MIKEIEQDVEQIRRFLANKRALDANYVSAQLAERQAFLKGLKECASLGYKGALVVLVAPESVPALSKVLAAFDMTVDAGSGVQLYRSLGVSRDEDGDFQMADGSLLFAEDLLGGVPECQYRVQYFENGLLDSSVPAVELGGTLPFKAALGLSITLKPLWDDLIGAARSSLAFGKISDAYEFYSKAISVGSTVAQFELSKVAIEDPRFRGLMSIDECVAMMVVSARKGVAPALKNVGMIFSRGLFGVDEDNMLGVHYLISYLEIVEGDDLDAVQVAYSNLEKLNFPDGGHLERLMMYLEVGIKSGDQWSEFSLAKLLALGYFVSNKRGHSKERGIRILKKMAKAGDVEAARILRASKRRFAA